MKTNRFPIALLLIVLFCVSLAFVSCNGTGEITTEVPDNTLSATLSSDVTTEVITGEVTTAPETTTEYEVTTEASVETTEPPHTHSFGAWTVVKTATCTGSGSEVRSCACGEKETRDVSTLGHKAGEWVVETAATCTQVGSKYNTCTACGEKLTTEEIPAYGHSAGEWVVENAATCTEVGSKYNNCSICGEKMTSEDIPATGHTDGEWIVDKEATAEVDGAKHQVCAICGVTIKTEIIAAKPHTLGKWIPNKEATCTEAGSKSQVCVECGVTVKTETIPALGHTEGEWKVDSTATCTEKGSKSVSCAVCKEVLKMEAIPALGHTEGEWKVDTSATCTEKGSKSVSCTVCKKVVKTESISALGHTEGEWKVDSTATCTEKGSKSVSCIVCKEVLKTEAISELGHTEVTDAAVPATCTANGLTEGKHCSVCQAVITAQQSVPAKGHAEAIDAAIMATCTESGLTEGKHCSVCMAVIIAQQTVPAIGHTDGAWVTEKAPTYTETGSKKLLCSVCGNTIKTETIPILEVVKIDYTVTVVDGNGNPVKDVEVEFISGNNVAATVKTDASGKAVTKIASGEYTVKLNVPDAYYVPSAIYKVTEAEPSAEVMIVGYVTSPQMIYPDTEDGVYSISVGSVCVPVEKDDMRYFFFAPKEGGVYHFYTDSDKVDVGYYGGSFYVSPTNSGKILEDGVLEIEVLHSAVGNIFAIGLKSTSSAVDECVLTVVKYSDIETQISELPWEQYAFDSSKVPEKQTTPTGSLHYVDILVDIMSNPLTPSGAVEEIKVVYSEKDGYYHLNTVDGPVLYAKIATKTIFQESLYTIINVTNVGRYFYDEEGKFLKKESYNDILMAYCAVADPVNGVVPLNDDLVYVLKNIGVDGWFDMTSPNSIFKDDGVFVYPHNAWLFAVCYFD